MTDTIDLPDGSADKAMFLEWLKKLHDVVPDAPFFADMGEYTSDQRYLKEVALNISARLKLVYWSLGIDDLIVELEE